MKKLLIIFLTLTLLVSLCACAQKVEDGGDKIPAQPSIAESVKPEKESSKPEEDAKPQAKNFEDILKSESYLLHYKGIITLDGEGVEMDVTFATNGEDTFIRNVMGDMTAEILVKDGVTYQIDSAAKTYLAVFETDGTEDVLDTTDLEPTGTGTAEVFGKTLPYKEYTDGEEITRFYLEGDQLYAVEVKSPDSESLMQVLELTGKVPAEMLELPAGYTEAEGMAYSEDMEGYADEILEDMEAYEPPDNQFTDLG